MKHMRAVESDSVKSARKANDKFHKACERASEIRERTLHRYVETKQNAHRQSSQHTSTSHALIRRGFGTSVPFIVEKQ